jgi:(4-alkanoyl-5-oxo-2,5-dihydrofuran-3-yl)methyl phosphate reductase
MILVTGGTGNIGSELVRLLAAAGQKVRALTRDPSKARVPAGVEVAKGDFDQPDSLAAALQGVEKALMNAAATAQGLAFIEAAKKARLGHVVMISSIGVTRGVGAGLVHAPSEKALQASGIPWTILRPAEFMTNFLWLRETIVGQGAIYRATGDGRSAVIHPHDIAAAAARVLTSDGHAGKIYELTGPSALSGADIAAHIAAAAGRNVRHVDIPLSVAREELTKRGFPGPLADAVTGFYGSVKDGHEAKIEPGLQQLIGNTGRTFEAWAKENAAAFH